MAKIDLLQGTLDMLVLQVLAGGAMHGWGIAQRIQLLSKDALQVEEGSLYPALYRMEHKGWIKSEWGQSENNRKAKFYELSAEGKRRLASETKEWDRLCVAIRDVMAGAN